MRNNPALLQQLQDLGLSKDEVGIFLSLLEGQKTQLQLSRDTGIARSNVYRIVDGLIEKGIVHELTTDDGRLLEAAQPDALELLVIAQENKAAKQRATLQDVMATLANMRSSEGDYAIKTYRGVAGLKQMLWNELKTKDELCIFTCGDIAAATGKQWAEKFRAESLTRGIKHRWLENFEITGESSDIPEYNEFLRAHTRRINSDILKIELEITIHDDTVSIYNSWTNDVHLGTEIKNPLLATFMRQVFEHYWHLAK
jgi:sugar-specific transcriptional regulator TrmB